MAKKKRFTGWREQCPNCQAQWSFEESDWNSCDACGYPNHEKEEEYDEDDSDVFEPEDYE